MRQHLCSVVIHLLPEKSLSLTSLAKTRARCSIQTTRCYSFWKKQLVSRCCSNTLNHPPLYFKMFLWNYSLWGYDEDENWAPLLHFAVSINLLYGGFQVLAGLLPEDDGGRFPLCHWVRWFWRWSSASRVCKSEEISLMKNTCLFPWSYKVNAHQIETFSSLQAGISWLWPANEYYLIKSGTWL